MAEFIWRFRFAWRLWRRGVPWSMARDSAWGGEYDPVPAWCAADDELWYMAQDAE